MKTPSLQMQLGGNLNGLKCKVENLAGWFQNDFNRMKEGYHL
jgi:hypothetical protein